MDFATIVFIFIIFILAILLLTSSAIGLKLYNGYFDFLKTAEPNKPELQDIVKKSNNMTVKYLWGGVGIGAGIIGCIILYIIFLIVSGQNVLNSLLKNSYTPRPLFLDYNKSDA